MLAEPTLRAASPPPNGGADAAVRAPVITVCLGPEAGSAAPDVSLPGSGEPEPGAAPLDLVPEQAETGHARRLGLLAVAGLVVSLAIHAGAVGAFLSLKRPEPPALDLPSVDVEIVTPDAEPPPAPAAAAAPEPEPQAKARQETQQETPPETRVAEVPLPPLEQPPLPAELTPPERQEPLAESTPEPVPEPMPDVAIEPPPTELPPLPEDLVPPAPQVAAVDPATVTIEPPPTEAPPLPEELKPPERPTIDPSSVTIDPPPTELIPLPSELTPPPPVRDAATPAPAAPAATPPRRETRPPVRRPPPVRTDARRQTRPTPQPAARAERRPASQASAASAGQGVASSQSQRTSTPPQTYLSRVMAQLNRARPAGTGDTGRVVVRFVIQRSGAATAIALARPSGVAAIDQAALAMVRRAAPFPPLPAEFAPASMSLSLPINFR